MIIHAIAGILSAAAAPDPGFNSSATDNDNVSEVNHDFSITLAAGTDRLLLVCGVVQGVNTFTAAVFDQGGGNQASTTLVRHVEGTSGTDLRIALFEYWISDAVATGAKTIRLTTNNAVAIVGGAVIYNNVGSPRSTDNELESHGAQPNPLNVTASANDLVVSVLGVDISSALFDPTNGDLSERIYIGTANANGVTLGFAEDLLSAGGTVDAGWTLSSGTPGATVDMCVAAAVYPHL